MSLDIDKAIGFALASHIRQKDKAGKPYILHPLRVAASFEDEPVLYVTALLHDVVEDTFGSIYPVTLKEIRGAFGIAVAIPVDYLTRRRAGMVPLYEGGTPVEKDEEYFDYIRRVKDNPVATRIKIADLYDNLSPRRLDGQEPARVSRYHKALQILCGGAHGTTGSEGND